MFSGDNVCGVEGVLLLKDGRFSKIALWTEGYFRENTAAAAAAVAAASAA